MLYEFLSSLSPRAKSAYWSGAGEYVYGPSATAISAKAGLPVKPGSQIESLPAMPITSPHPTRAETLRLGGYICGL